VLRRQRDGLAATGNLRAWPAVKSERCPRRRPAWLARSSGTRRLARSHRGLPRRCSNQPRLLLDSLRLNPARFRLLKRSFRGEANAFDR
jgi:hypothetical protein